MALTAKQKIFADGYLIDLNATRVTRQLIRKSKRTKLLKRQRAEYTLGWNYDKNGWWYADSKTSYYKSCWHIINGHKYRFNSDGYALTG